MQSSWILGLVYELERKLQNIQSEISHKTN